MMRVFVLLLPFVVTEYTTFDPIENNEQVWAHAMNTTIDPCDNFHEFACGQWYPYHRPVKTEFDEMMKSWIHEIERLLQWRKVSGSHAVNKAYAFFQACVQYTDEEMNRDALKGIKRLLGMFSVKENKVIMNLTSMLVETRLFSPPMLEVNVEPDHVNKSRNMIKLSQSSYTVVESPSYFMRSSNYATELIDRLADKLKIVAKEMGATWKNSAVRRHIEEVLEFQRTLAGLRVSRHKELTVQRLKLSEFDVLFPLNSFSLSDYLHSIAPSELHSYLNSDPEILVGDVKYFERLAHLLNKTPPKVIINYFILGYASNALHPKKEEYRSAYCAIRTKNTLQLAVRTMHASEKFSLIYQETAGQIAEGIRSTIVEMLQGIRLAGQELKPKLTGIVTSMRFEIGDSEWVRNTTEVDNFYRELDINESYSFGEMKKIYASWETKAILSELAVPDVRDRWDTEPPWDTIIRYVRSKNILSIPWPQLRQTRYGTDLPVSLIWGCFGTIISHEIMYGLDTMEVREMFGNGTDKIYKLWDANTTIHPFQQCLAEQYSAEWVPEISKHLDGSRTVQENSADNAGFAAAYRAFEKSLDSDDNPYMYTNKQLFFISYAQSMCSNETVEELRDIVSWSRNPPNSYRVNVVLRNQKAFADAFQCPVGSPMNPIHKCQFW